MRNNGFLGVLDIRILRREKERAMVRIAKVSVSLALKAFLRPTYKIQFSGNRDAKETQTTYQSRNWS